MKFPSKKYDVVYADVPWHYYGDKYKMAAAGKHYDLMSLEEICALPIYDLLTDKGVLFLWATCPRLDWAMEAIYEWDLYFRGVGFVWVKTTKAGEPLKARGVRPSFIKPLTELVLIASKQSKGRPLPLRSEKIVQTVFAPPREHSRKPPEVRERIQELFKPSVKRIELFARESTSGWENWGFEKGLFDE
jgi:N6-adenosine-specific RNA methylase IME4